MNPTWRLTEPAVAAYVTAAVAAGLDVIEAAEAARRVRVHAAIGASEATAAWQRPVLAAAARNNVLGIALAMDVFLLEPQLLGHWPLIAHEITHTAQYLRRGTPGFLLRYAWQYLHRRARGMSDRDAYYALPDEVEARRVEASARHSVIHGPPLARCAD